jgi:hypothetical protein
MPTDETNEPALQKLKDQYGDQIEKFEYEVRKKPYLGKEPKGAFCCGMTRYRKVYKVSHVVLKDGTRIPVGSVGCLVRMITILVTSISILIFIII